MKRTTAGWAIGAVIAILFSVGVAYISHLQPVESFLLGVASGIAFSSLGLAAGKALEKA